MDYANANQCWLTFCRVKQDTIILSSLCWPSPPYTTGLSNMPTGWGVHVSMSPGLPTIVPTSKCLSKHDAHPTVIRTSITPALSVQQCNDLL